MIETCGASRSLARRVLFPGVAQGRSASVDKRRDTFVAGVVERAQHEVTAGDFRSYFARTRVSAWRSPATISPGSRAS